MRLELAVSSEGRASKMLPVNCVKFIKYLNYLCCMLSEELGLHIGFVRSF
jgi:hypothetical protein